MSVYDHRTSRAKRLAISRRAFSSGRSFPQHHPYVQEGRLHCGQNVYPSELRDQDRFKTTVTQYHQAMTALAEDITRLHCISGDDVSCGGLKISGYYTPGTFQQYVLSKANYVTPIPEDLASEIAAPLLCGGVTVYSALKKSGAQPGDFVVIPGCSGGLGHLGLQLGSRVFGYRMIGIDSGDKKAIAEECGCEFFFDLGAYSRDEEGTEKLIEDIKKTSDGQGATAVVLCTGSKAAYDMSIRLLRTKGTVVCVGVPNGDVTPIAGADPGTLVAKQLKIVGSAVGNRLEAIETLNYAARRLIKTKITVENLQSLNEVFRKIKDGRLQGRAVISLTD
ncbi:uncharacterized protein PV06_11065 [Exophiala oligosperma]|uniref:Enoyl reductase (ER) domain-containing protein n=1 Tax=Exophiala oligosperma TaxID=215243 RepID=A0A0D2DM15_9EURO|nr:uncharacterized protein PV06_11065 [Exophiala oligosperma]KIW36779.1 hypothetical protein PV06_11065 [Exophiala oligosperma]